MGVSLPKFFGRFLEAALLHGMLHYIHWRLMVYALLYVACCFHRWSMAAMSDFCKVIIIGIGMDNCVASPTSVQDINSIHLAAFRD